MDAKIGDSQISGKVPRTVDGKYIFAIGSDTGINNVLVVSNGKRGDYSIDRVYRINLEYETLIEEARDAIYGIEGTEEGQYSLPKIDLIEGSFGQGLIRVSSVGNVQSYDTFREARSNRTSGSNGRENALNYNFGQNGSGNDRTNSPDQSGTDSAEVASSLPAFDTEPEIEWSVNDATTGRLSAPPKARRKMPKLAILPDKPEGTRIAGHQAVYRRPMFRTSGSSQQRVPGRKYQRCVVHFYRNAFSVVPRKKMQQMAAMLKTIHVQENKDAARKKPHPLSISSGR